jgi:uncharacterized membrane protein (DUF106 family)
MINLLKDIGLLAISLFLISVVLCSGFYVVGEVFNLSIHPVFKMFLLLATIMIMTILIGLSWEILKK